MGVQDYGHLVFAQKLADRMHHVFPGREVTDVTVRYLDERPCFLEISYQDLTEAVTEVYMHKVDPRTRAPIVECRKTVESLTMDDHKSSDSDESNGARVYSKVQSFETGEAQWVEETNA